MVHHSEVGVAYQYTGFEGKILWKPLHFLYWLANSDSFPDIDVLVVPSAEHHLDSDREGEEMISFVKEVGQQARYVLM